MTPVCIHGPTLTPTVPETAGGPCLECSVHKGLVTCACALSGACTTTTTNYVRMLALCFPRRCFKQAWWAGRNDCLLLPCALRCVGIAVIGLTCANQTKGQGCAAVVSSVWLHWSPW